MASIAPSGAEILLVQPTATDASWGLARSLIRSYAEGVTQPGCFPELSLELAKLHEIYAGPSAGLFLAHVNGVAAGCCAFRPRWDSDYVNACEMKRLYVSPQFRGMGLGYRLASAVMAAARASGFFCMLLDTLDEMEAARALYVEMGFVPIPPYTQGSVAGAHHLLVSL